MVSRSIVLRLAKRNPCPCSCALGALNWYPATVTEMIALYRDAERFRAIQLAGCLDADCDMSHFDYMTHSL